ncbi:F-box protein At3g07870 [Daucus carota subsp. sativus]|nr:PREDICTED: F-box protein At3g07870-like [Daucus carota subsp. sativus]XP_017217753.1 PREDICTED: F-box protein At3g07870-like [Daucus carota subsp. sativus]XP_017217760.1 PREDICTED: F-box protein At3g07870-like [Daucus carota subsp. sativus]
MVVSKQPMTSTRHPPRFHHTNITHLPDHLISDILARLPTISLFTSKFVCTLWYHLTSKDPHFPKLHFSKPHLEMLAQSKEESALASVNWVHPEFDVFRGFGKQAHLKPRLQLPYTNCGLVSSCNGIVLCLHRQRYCDLGIICNPLSGEYALLPRCLKGVEKYERLEIDEEYDDYVIDSGYVSDHFNVYGFGYCGGSNCFKVLRIFSSVSSPKWMDSGSAMVLDVGSDSWRRIGDSPFCPSVGSVPVLVNGVLHWVCDVNNCPRFVVWFDFESERFGEFGPPFGILKKFQKRKYRMTLGILEGCLTLCDVLRTGKFDIWVMKKYGDLESWSKDFAVDTMVVDMFLQGRYRPMQVLSTGELLLFSLGNSRTYPKLVCYDPDDHEVRMLKLLCFARFELYHHSPTFISLKDLIPGDNLNVLNVKQGLATDGKWKSEAPYWIGNGGTWPGLFLLEHCVASVDNYRRLPD